MANIEIISVQLNNFLSYKSCTINFKNGIVPIIGSTDNNPLRSNGAGKSAIAEAIYWCIYGKPLRKITVDELVNAEEAKDCFVRLSIKNVDDGRLAYITRHRKHVEFGNSFVMAVSYVDGGYSEHKTQEDINAFIGMDDVMFANSVMFGRSDKLMLFSRMSDSEKKDFIRRVCPQLKKLDEQNEYYRKQVANIKQRGIELDRDIAAVEGRIKVRKDMVARLHDMLTRQKNALATAKNMVVVGNETEVHAELEAVQAKIKKLKDYGESKKFKEFIDLSDKYEREIGELQAKSIRLNSEVATHNANIKKSRSAIKCPACNRPFDNASELQEFAAAEETKCVEIRQHIEVCKAALNELRKNHLDISENIRKHKEAVQDATSTELQLVKKLQTFVDANNNRKHAISAAMAAIETTKATLDEAEYALSDDEDIASVCMDDSKELKDKLAIASILEHATSSVGLQSYIADSFLADIEFYANKFLHGMSDSLKLSIVSGKSLEKNSREGRINITVDNPDGGLTYGSTSSGESARIEFAIMFGVVAAIQQWCGSTMKFMFLDESFDAAVDDAGAKAVVEMLKTHILPWKEKIYITSHRSDIKDLFDEALMVNKCGNSSGAYYV